MYQLLVSADEVSWTGKPFELAAFRYLEATDEALKARYGRIDSPTIAELRRIPALFVYEIPIVAPARVGWITSVQQRDGDLRVSYRFDDAFDPVPPDSLENLAWDLEIGKYEFTRTHWAIKSADLFSVLKTAGFASEAAESSNTKSHFAFSRRTLIAASDMLKALGHTAFDRFILELGVDGIDAGREKGGLLARANALAEFLLANQSAPTAEGESLSYAVVHRAALSDPNYPEGDAPGVDEESRRQFWSSLGRDGYTLANGELISTEDAERPLFEEGVAADSATVELSAIEPTSVVAPPEASIAMASNKVFLVHGRDHGSMHEVARFLERIGLDVVILHERPNGGRTLISKFQEESSDTSFAVVLMTQDDLGKLKGDNNPTPRARQNVVFELGFFIGRLGADRVCALVSDGVERPSDFEAVVYIELGPQSAWKTDLARELRNAGVPFDHSKVF